MDPRLARDLDDFDAVLERALRLAQAFLDGLDERPVAARLLAEGPGNAATLPEAGIGAAAALDGFHRDYDRYLSASAGPRYFGFVTGGVTPAALAADWLTAACDQNAQQRSGDSCAPQIEMQALDMLRQLLGWPAGWTGVCVTGATMANFSGLALARQWYGRALGRDIAADGTDGLPAPAVFAGSAHSSIGKALSMLGLGRNALRPLPLLPGREALDVGALRDALAGNDAPAIVCTSAGTVNTADFDDLAAIARLKRAFPFWLHVDAAFGGIAAASPRYRDRLVGIEAADSVAVDAHKWLNLPYDCAVMFNAHLPRQVEVFQNRSDYLAPPEATADNYLHLGPENSRRLRALPLWMSLRAYGRAGYADIVERNCAAARHFGTLVESEPRLRLAAPVRLNVACFRLADGDDAALAALHARLVAEGTAFFSASRLDGRAILRAAVCNWRTRIDDVERAFTAVRDALDALPR